MINIGDILICKMDTPCGRLKVGQKCKAMTSLWTRGYGPEVSVIIDPNHSHIDIQIIYLASITEQRESKINSIIND